MWTFSRPVDRRGEKPFEGRRRVYLRAFYRFSAPRRALLPSSSDAPLDSRTGCRSFGARVADLLDVNVKKTRKKPRNNREPRVRRHRREKRDAVRVWAPRDLLPAPPAGPLNWTNRARGGTCAPL